MHRRLIAARCAQPALTLGSYHPISAQGDLILYTRAHGGSRVLVALNLGADSISVAVPQSVRGKVLVSCFADRDDEDVDGGFELRPHQGLIIALAP